MSHTHPLAAFLARLSLADLPEPVLEFHQSALTDPGVSEFRDKVLMQLDAEVDSVYPQRWLGRIEVHTTDGRVLQGAIDSPKGDPDNTLSRAELEDKFRRLLAFAGALDGDQAGVLIERVWGLREARDLKGLMEMNNAK